MNEVSQIIKYKAFNLKDKLFDEFNKSQKKILLLDIKEMTIFKVKK